jgi:type III secretion protein V
VRGAIRERAGEVLDRLRQGELHVVLGRYSEILLAVLVITAITIMIIPIPTFLLDVLLTANMAIAIAVLMICLYVPDALSLASFPTILLLATLFRIALEVSATRLILLYADAGEVIHAFGSFVVKGNLVVGLVIFLIITILQLVVVAKGAERVSEVAARFTLDAMPGKQMSIDADLRAGLVDASEAKRRRRLLERESQFHGAMDGAMKFVKGDAVAGILISAINLVAGFIIGVWMKGFTVEEAVRRYSILTIGEGLVAQIPSLIITIGAAVLITRVASSDEGSSLGREVGAQLLSQPTAIGIAAALMAAMALVPGMPTVPFLLLAGVSGATSWSLIRTRRSKEREEARAAQIVERRRELPAPGSPELHLPVAVPVIVEASAPLTPWLDVGQRGERFMNELLPQMRYWLFQDIGLVLPGVRIRGDAAHLGDHQYVIHVHEVPVAGGEAWADRVFATDPDAARALGLDGPPGTHPLTGRPGVWVDEGAALAGGAGPQAILPPDEFIALHLSRVVKRHGEEILGIQEVQNFLDAMEEQGFGALVKTVVPKLLSVQRLTEILRRLMREEISIKNMKSILEALAEWAPYETDPVFLTEYVRMNLKRYIAHRFGNGEAVLPVYLLEPGLEQAIRGGIRHTASGSKLSLDPESSQAVMESFRRAFARVDLAATRPLVLAQMEVRYFVKRLLSLEYPDVPVLSFQELPADVRVQPVGQIPWTAGPLPAPPPAT